jgi:hypothetical protein
MLPSVLKPSGLAHRTHELTINQGTAYTPFAELRQGHDADDAAFLIDGSHSPGRVWRHHDLDFGYERYESRKDANYHSKYKTMGVTYFLLFSNAEADTVNDRLRL